MNQIIEMNRNFLKSLQKQLNYIFWECPTEEYDPEEAKVLIALKRHYITLTESPIHIAYHNQSQSPRIIYISHTTPVRKTPAILGIAVAACIVSILIIGNTEPVGALPDTGFFHFLKKDKSGILAITSPSYTKTTSTPEPTKDCNCCEECDCGCNDDN